jgi:hypothetical protein
MLRTTNFLHLKSQLARSWVLLYTFWNILTEFRKFQYIHVSFWNSKNTANHITNNRIQIWEQNCTNMLCIFDLLMQLSHNEKLICKEKWTIFKQKYLHNNQDINGVTILTNSAGDKPIVVRIHNWWVKDPVNLHIKACLGTANGNKYNNGKTEPSNHNHLNKSSFLVKFIFHLVSFPNFNHLQFINISNMK